MSLSAHVRYAGHHSRVGYAATLTSRAYTALFVPFITIALVAVAIVSVSDTALFAKSAVSPEILCLALVLTLVRLAAAYILAVACAIPLSLLAVKSRLMERILLPAFDIVQSVPVLAFFPVLILVFARTHFLAGAAVFILFLSMVWNLVFSLVGGLNVLPQDFSDAAKVFRIRGWRYLRIVLIPSVVPYLITGSLLAWAQGWNIIIVAEVLHTYIPHGTSAYDLLGVGSLLVNASASGDNSTFLYTLLIMVAAIGLMNIFVWQRLLRYAERFKFE